MISKATLLGRVGKKEDKNLKNGSNLTVLSIATNRKWIDKMGAKQESTSWHNVNCFNKLGEIASKYATVGDLIYIEGEILNKKIQTQDGAERWMYSVTANEIKLLPTGKKQDSESTPIQKAPISDFDDSGIPF